MFLLVCFFVIENGPIYTGDRSSVQMDILSSIHTGVLSDSSCVTLDKSSSADFL